MLLKVLEMPLYGTRGAPGKFRIVGGLALAGIVFWLVTEGFVHSGYFVKKIAFLSVWCLGGAAVLACFTICQAIYEKAARGIMHGGLLTVGCTAAALVALARMVRLLAMT